MIKYETAQHPLRNRRGLPFFAVENKKKKGASSDAKVEATIGKKKMLFFDGVKRIIQNEEVFLSIKNNEKVFLFSLFAAFEKMSKMTAKGHRSSDESSYTLRT